MNDNLNDGPRSRMSGGPGPSADADGKLGVALLAHGSRSGSDTIDGLRLMVERLQERLRPRRAKVAMACLEFIAPDLPDAVSALVADGRSDIIVMPFLLGQGTHFAEDLDAEIARAAARHPDARIRASQAFGCDPALVDIAADRALAVRRAAVNGAAAGPGDAMDSAPDGVMLVKAGTRSPAENHVWLHQLGRMLEARLGHGHAVAVAQSHFGEPSMDAAAADLILNRRAKSIVCVPYIFFPGLILTRNILGGVEKLQARYPGVPFRAATTLGVDPRLVDLTARRVVSAIPDSASEPPPASANNDR